MKRVLLVHWKESELPERVARLSKAGYGVTTLGSTEPRAFTAISKTAADAILIDLSRLPSHGRTAAYVFRQQKSTRLIPIVFVGGQPDKIANVRKLLPDAIFTDWPNIAGSMKKALAWKNKNPVVPKSSSGYSGTPLPKKLGVDGDRTVLLMAAPETFAEMIELNGSPRLNKRGPADVVLFFVKSKAELRRGLAKAIKAMNEPGGIWIAWPKKASGTQTDLSENDIRDAGLAEGIVDYKVCAIDQTWSGLKFARRKSPKR